MSGQDKKHRSHLPMPNTSRPGLITYDAKDPDRVRPQLDTLESNREAILIEFVPKLIPSSGR
jgi:hypothetical protein